MKYVTEYQPKPIPHRQFDWTAVADGYEPGQPIGHGRTEAEAISNLADVVAADETPVKEWDGGE